MNNLRALTAGNKKRFAIFALIIITIIITSSNYLVMFILLIFELFMIDTLIDGSVDKKDTNLLKEQLDFFSEIRHAYPPRHPSENRRRRQCRSALLLP